MTSRQMIHELGHRLNNEVGQELIEYSKDKNDTDCEWLAGQIRQVVDTNYKKIMWLKTKKDGLK